MDAKEYRARLWKAYGAHMAVGDYASARAALKALKGGGR